MSEKKKKSTANTTEIQNSLNKNISKLFEKDFIPVFTNDQDLQMIFCCALRYALGRRSMSTRTVPDFIKSNIIIIDQKWFIIYLQDLCRYEKDRETWGSDQEHGYDGLCDYEGWLAFKKFLINEYNKRGFCEPVTHYQGINLTALKLFYSKNRVREYIGSCQTISEAVNHIYDFLKKNGNVPTHHRSIEKYAIVFYDIGSATEWFELETIEFSKEKPRTVILEKLAKHGYPFADQYDKNGNRKYL